MVSAAQLKRCFEFLEDATLLRIMDNCQYELKITQSEEVRKQLQIMYNVAKEIMK